MECELYNHANGVFNKLFRVLQMLVTKINQYKNFLSKVRASSYVDENH